MRDEQKELDQGPAGTTEVVMRSEEQESEPTLGDTFPFHDDLFRHKDRASELPTSCTEGLTLQRSTQIREPQDRYGD